MIELLFLLGFTLHNIEEAIWLPRWSKKAGKFHKAVSAGQFRFAVTIITALYYLIPLNRGFKISMAIREDERNFILEADEYKGFHEILHSAKKYSEGYNIRFDIFDETGYDFSKRFLLAIICQR